LNERGKVYVKGMFDDGGASDVSALVNQANAAYSSPEAAATELVQDFKGFAKKSD
jgi:hypothetical protein